MRVALAGALASSAGPSAALALIRALLRRGLIVPLISALRQEDGADLLRAFGWTRPQSAALAAMGARPSLTDPPSHLFAAIAAPWFAAWGREDARSLWLACALCAIERPALMAQRSLTGKAAAWIASFCVESDDEAPSERSTSSDILSAGLRPPLDVLQFDRPVNTPVFDSRSPEPIPAFLPEAATSTKPEPPPLPQWKGAQHTPRAGLFFLVPVMDRLGIDRWMAENPEMAAWSFPNLVLRDVAVRLGARPSDPVLAALGELDHEIPGAVRAAVQDWTRRIRQYTRRVARIGLHNLVCRPGRITARQTHIDVMFRLELVDIRVRRAGLDIDPGWTPWLLRVIHFHYVAGDVYDT
jgi:hypothetical protein